MGIEPFSATTKNGSTFPLCYPFPTRMSQGSFQEPLNTLNAFDIKVTHFPETIGRKR